MNRERGYKLVERRFSDLAEVLGYDTSKGREARSLFDTDPATAGGEAERLLESEYED